MVAYWPALSYHDHHCELLLRHHLSREKYTNCSTATVNHPSYQLIKEYQRFEYLAPRRASNVSRLVAPVGKSLREPVRKSLPHRFSAF